MYKHIFTHPHPYKYTYISITYELCLGGGTRCSERVTVPCFTSDTRNTL